ncbi:MAG: SRPBCC family protein [Chloroflexi bacterium]|nr:SRPBCC family protein [Chloroflexota bacterium]
MPAQPSAHVERPTNLQLTHAPFAKTEMLIRKPVAEVFEAFVNPEITCKFWFSKSSGRLETGKQIQWDWEMYGASVQVGVKALEKNGRILIEWGAYGKPTEVEWTFSPRGEHATFVSITNSGFDGDGDEVVKQALDSMEGFALVLSGLKALLEHNVVLNLISDRFPDLIVSAGDSKRA